MRIAGEIVIERNVFLEDHHHVLDGSCGLVAVSFASSVGPGGTRGTQDQTGGSQHSGGAASVFLDHFDFPSLRIEVFVGCKRGLRFLVVGAEFECYCWETSYAVFIRGK